jgi:hypothetical protein
MSNRQKDYKQHSQSLLLAKTKLLKPKAKQWFRAKIQKTALVERGAWTHLPKDRAMKAPNWRNDVPTTSSSSSSSSSSLIVPKIDLTSFKHNELIENYYLATLQHTAQRCYNYLDIDDDKDEEAEEVEKEEEGEVEKQQKEEEESDTTLFYHTLF